MQDNQDTETSTDEVQREYKKEIPVEAKFSIFFTFRAVWKCFWTY